MTQIRITRIFRFETAHALPGLTRNTPQENIEALLSSNGVEVKAVYMEQPSTCEAMLADFARKIKGRLPAHVRLHSLKLYETSASYAEWYACDNPEP